MHQATTTKINRIVTLLRDNKHSLLPLIRRFSIGCLIGFIIVFLIASLPDDTKHAQNTTKQKFSIANLFQAKTPNPSDVVSKTDFQKFESNKQALSPTQIQAIENDEPRMTLVITDFGNNTAIMDKFGELIQSPVTLGINASIPQYNPTAATLNTLGYEVWLDIQTITSNSSADNGNMALNPVREFDYNINLLEQQMSNKASTTGIIIKNTSLLPQSTDLWIKMSHDIFAQGYGIFDATSHTLPTSIAYYNEAYAPYIKNSVTIDTDTSVENLEKQLSAIQKTIETNNNIIITTSIYTPVALDIIARWVNFLTSKGIVIIPLSAQTKL